MPGKKEGENKLVRTAAGSVDVYTWAGGAWQKVGEMTDGVGSGQKTTYDGKEWDYVFEVDVQEGAPKLMLPYNANGSHRDNYEGLHRMTIQPQKTLTLPHSVS